MEIAPGIRRLGNGLVNAYLLEEGGAVTVIDAGLPGYWRALPGELAAMGRTLADVRAILLTHAHSDHIGFAERLRRSSGVPVRVHERDAALARGEEKTRGSLGRIRPLPIARFLLYAMRNGFSAPPILEVSTFADGERIDGIPGSPRAIHVPGHTAGSAALHVASRGVLFIGDAIVTLGVASGAAGPQLSAFGADDAQALASLERLEGIEARLMLPGHGEPWAGGVGEAVRIARSRAKK